MGRPGAGQRRPWAGPVKMYLHINILICFIPFPFFRLILSIMRVVLHRSSRVGPPVEVYATIACMSLSAHQMLGPGSSDKKVCSLDSSYIC